MSFTRSRAARIGLLAGTVAVSAAAQLPAAAQSVNATQLSIVVAPMKIEATRLGGEISFSGSGLDAGAMGRLDATGAYTAGTAFSANAGATFNVDMSVRAAGVAPTVMSGTDYAAGTFASATADYGYQKVSWSNTTPATVGTLAFNNANVATIDAVDNQGVSATLIHSTKKTGLGSSMEVRRVVISSNDQLTTEGTQQTARYQVGGTGIGTLADANMASAALGAVSAITVATGITASNNSFSETVDPGQAADEIVISTTSVTSPAYGKTVITTGGTTAGAITVGNINTASVVSGGAGTAASMSVIGTMTTFN